MSWCDTYEICVLLYKVIITPKEVIVIQKQSCAFIMYVMFSSTFTIYIHGLEQSHALQVLKCTILPYLCNGRYMVTAQIYLTAEIKFNFSIIIK